LKPHAALQAERAQELRVAIVEHSPSWWKPRNWLNHLPSTHDMAAVGVSFLVHLTAILVLLSIFRFAPIRDTLGLAVMHSIEPVDEDLIPQEFHFSPEAYETVGALGNKGLGEARPTAPVQAPRSEIHYALEPPTPIGEIAVEQFDRTVLEGPNIPENVIVKGAGSVGVEGATGAVDRITHEVLLSLDERPTLVVWLVDQSGCLKPQRESIA
jgi:hypothetical protein